ncbi:hypothetical protein GSH19_03150 [Lactobacillus sp. S2-2]|uniref:ABC transporter permease n=1 Tax=Lactobacillus sp. S2-2 TaxID=2692917 RepID=UPI001F3DAB60|nr:ABC transporter permease [Lactobacillus sp. S2-2]MCF6515162.1 hypothetical protein [Lactobacillus sp. S2-2]
MIKNLFKERLGQHYKMLFKYFKYVFNDFFLIAVMFMLGGLSLAYSNFLNQLNPNNLFIKCLVILILFLSTKIGSFATFLKEADKVFLLPIEFKIHKYLKYTFVDSFIVSAFFQMLIFLVTFPMIKIVYQTNLLDFIFYILILLILKMINLLFEMNQLFSERNNLYSMTINIINLLILILFAIINPILGIILAIGLLFYVLFNLLKNQNNRFEWNLAISNESHRMRRIYQFFNLFTEVPFLKGKVARRKYLDFVFNLFDIKDANLYLYLKGIIRNKEYSGLFLRLTILGTVLLFFVNNTYLNIGLSILFIYLLAFQLVPFYYFFDDNVFTHIYPLKLKNKIKSFKKLLYVLLLVVVVLFTIATAFFNIGIASVAFVLMIIEVLLFNELYLSKKLNN